MVSEQLFRNPDQDEKEAFEATASTKNFQNEVRQWFTAMSAEERAAVLGFEDDSLIVAALLSRMAGPSSSIAGSHDNSGRSPDDQRNISMQQIAPTSSLPPKRTTDELFSNETFDWEAKVAIDIIEKTWEEIMMVGLPNTSGVNQKDFVKSTMHHKDEENNDKAPLGEPVGNGSTNALERKAEEKSDQESTILDEVVSDAYRIQNGGVDAVGKAASATAQETADSTVTESCQLREKGDKGKANDDTDVGSSPTNPLEFATTAINTASSPSATHGIEAGLQYPSESHNSRRIIEVMDNTRCILPAASKITSTATNGDHSTSQHPFITINPTYLESVTGDELLVAFDEIMAMAYTDSSSDEPCSFILPEEATSASWIDLVRSYASTDASSPSQSIPLYILVLCRFQYSLAKAYSERTPTNGSDNEQATDSQLSIPVKSKAQWLSALTERIRELEKSKSPEIQKILADLASKFPTAGELGDSETSRNLEDYLLLPFSVVSERLGKNLETNSRMDEELKRINLGLEKSIQDLNTTESGEVGNGIGPEGNEVSLESDSQNFLNSGNNTASNGAKKGKKKKKKKKRKGSTAKGKAEEGATTTVVEDTGGAQENGNATEPLPEVSLDASVDPKENSSVIVESQVDKEVPLTEVKQQITTDVPLATDAKSISNAKSGSECETKETPKNSETDTLKKTDLSPTDDSVSAVHPQPKPCKEEIVESKSDNAPKEAESTKEDDNDDQWETVEIRPRGRKKTSDKGNSTRQGSHNGGNNGNSNSQNGANKKKAPRTKETRARTKNRKMVREILGGVLDSVEETVRRRRAVSRDRANALRSRAQSLPMNINSTAAPQNSATNQTSGSSLRDILLRGKDGNQSQQSKNQNATKAAPLSYSERARSLLTSDSSSLPRRKNEKQTQITGSKTSKALKAARAQPADQSTIPTIASTSSAFTPSVANVTSRKFGAASSSDSSDSESVEDKKLKKTLSDPIKFASPSPPLPTLLSPGNNNSTSSSVASSLDAPHAGHHGNKSRQSENDVGCHLLDVCDRLSTEIDVFMQRREVALAVRRHERGLVLAALEKTLGLIWPGKPSVEMYGSCATNLDLPSSDLDVVVCGLDKPFVDIVTSPSNASSVVSDSTGDQSPADSKKGRDNGSPDADSRKDSSTFSPDQRYSRHQMSQYQMQMMYGHMSANAERVLRLAMELEHQPWAVHVKAIPTASVPVIKILADPARLKGADWLVQQPIDGQSPPSLNKDQTPMTPFQNQQSSPLWRGADVVNGLLKVDITFEGPEHGGIGSTKFSQKVVEDFSSESGLAPESTPQVQVLMVLKELLAQRRSNEPFSGGLSSYALLLLVISMIGERSIIREELEKTERQRRVMAADEGNSVLQSASAQSMDATSKGAKQSTEKTQSKTTGLTKTDGNHSNATRATAQNENATTKNNGKGNPTPKTTAWQDRQDKQDQKKPSKNTASAVVPPPVQKKAPAPSSWASIARSRAPSVDLTSSKKKKDTQEKDKSIPSKEPAAPDVKEQKAPSKPSSFADAVAKGKPMQVPKVNPTSKKAQPVKKNEGKKRFDGLLDPPSSKAPKPKTEKEESKNSNAQQTKGNSESAENAKAPENNISSTSNHSKEGAARAPETIPLDSSGFPQGFHDVIEVLCSGETTPGKLLMHFLLFYGQHFESQSTAIDYSGTHTRDAAANNGYSVRSAYMLRRNTGSYDPVKGMYTVDPIVIYDPLEGAENNNVARSCFAWSSIRWVFAQSYMTLSSAAEQNATDGRRKRSSSTASEGPSYGHDESGNVVVDPSSPLLELLLSY